jgi:pantothenate kinase
MALPRQISDIFVAPRLRRSYARNASLVTGMRCRLFVNVYAHCRETLKNADNHRPLIGSKCGTIAMTKSELVRKLAEANPQLSLYHHDVEVIVTLIFDQIAAALARHRACGRGFFRPSPPGVMS